MAYFLVDVRTLIQPYVTLPHLCEQRTIFQPVIIGCFNNFFHERLLMMQQAAVPGRGSVRQHPNILKPLPHLAAKMNSDYCYKLLSYITQLTRLSFQSELCALGL